MDDFMCGIFDFNGDGVTDCGELSMGMCLMEEEERAEAAAIDFAFDFYSDLGDGDF